MTNALSAFTKLLVTDPEATARSYESLGFTRVGTDGTFIHLRWATGGDVMLVRRPAGARLSGPVGLGVLLGFVSPFSLSTLGERAEKAGLSTQGPVDQPWNTRELIISDPDGYRLNFIEPIPAVS